MDDQEGGNKKESSGNEDSESISDAKESEAIDKQEERLDEPYCDYSEITLREKQNRVKLNLCVFCAKELPENRPKQQKFCREGPCVAKKKGQLPSFRRERHETEERLKVNL